MQLINCEVELLFPWDPHCVSCTLAGASNFTLTDAKRYVPIVTLLTEGNSKLSELLSEGFKRPFIGTNTALLQKNHTMKMIP